MPADDLLKDLKCEVCGGPAIGVASSGYGPISHAYCRTCIVRGAEPIGGFHYLYDFVSDNGEGLAPEINNWSTFRDGRYISWPEYVAERRRGPICEIHKVHALPDGCAICGYEQWSEAPGDDEQEAQ